MQSMLIWHRFPVQAAVVPHCPFSPQRVLVQFGFTGYFISKRCILIKRSISLGLVTVQIQLQMSRLWKGGVHSHFIELSYSVLMNRMEPHEVSVCICPMCQARLCLYETPDSKCTASFGGNNIGFFFFLMMINFSFLPSFYHPLSLLVQLLTVVVTSYFLSYPSAV